MTADKCAPLPVYVDGKQCVSCWQLSWKEKLSALLFGRIWLYVLSGETQPPVALVCVKKQRLMMQDIKEGGRNE